MKRLGALALLLGSPLFADAISFGVRAGVPLTDLADTVQSPNFGFNSDTPRWLFGPTFEVRLPFGFGFHIDALYRRFSVQAVAGQASASSSFGFWQFPIMGKYRFGAGPWRPFVAAGPSFSKLTGTGGVGSCVISGLSGPCAGQVLKDSGTGFAIGAGLDAKIPVVRLTPELRYTRLGADYLGSTNNSLNSQRNQFEFILGVTF